MRLLLIAAALVAIASVLNIFPVYFIKRNIIAGVVYALAAVCLAVAAFFFK